MHVLTDGCQGCIAGAIRLEFICQHDLMMEVWDMDALSM